MPAAAMRLDEDTIDYFGALTEKNELAYPRLNPQLRRKNMPIPKEATGTRGSLALLTIALLNVTSAFACFPDPGAKPTHDVRELQLRAKPVEPSVVYTVKGYAFYIAVDDFLAFLAKDRRVLEKPDDLAESLKARLPLTEDLNTHEFVSSLIPEIDAAEHAKRSEKALIHRRQWQRAQRELEYAVAALLEQNKAAILDLSSEEVLETIKVDKYSEICFGGRRFQTQDGRVLLSVADWIS